MTHGDSVTVLSRSDIYFFDVTHRQLSGQLVVGADRAFSAFLAGAEVATVGGKAETVGEEGAAAAMRGLAGPHRAGPTADRHTRALALQGGRTC